MREGLPIIDGQRIPNGYQQITSLSSATALTVPVGTRLCFIQAEDQNIRWRDDGVNPTASVGMVITTDSILLYTGAGETNPFAAIRFIEETASAKLNVSYYK